MEKTYMAGGVIRPREDDRKAELVDAKSTGDAIPREPEKQKLVGHRAKITKI